MKKVVLIKSATGQYTEVNFGQGPEAEYDAAIYGTGVYLCDDASAVYIMGVRKNLVNKVKFMNKELIPDVNGDIVIPVQMVGALPADPDADTVYFVKSPTVSE